MRTLAKYLRRKYTAPGVKVGAFVGFRLAMPGDVIAGVPFQITAYAVDAWGHQIITNTATPTFTSNDAAGTMPAGAALVAGEKIFVATLKTTVSRTVTATDSVTAAITVIRPIVVKGAPANKYLQVVMQPPAATITAGIQVFWRVIPQDVFNNNSNNYSGTVHFTSTDVNAVLPQDTVWTSFAQTFPAMFSCNVAIGTYTVTATDTVTASITKASSAFVVLPDPYVLQAPVTTRIGVPFFVVVVATNPDGSRNLGYTGTAHFTSTDPLAVLPSDTIIPPNSGGFVDVTVTLFTVGFQDVTATDTVSPIITGTIAVEVTQPPDTADHFILTLSAATCTAGDTLTLGITALDANGNIDAAYAGTVHFRCNDSQATIPEDSELTAGHGLFPVTFKTAGPVQITANESVKYGSTPLATVLPNIVTSYSITPAAFTTVAGLALLLTVKALDTYGNATAGSVHFTSTDTAATLPANAAIASKTIGTFTATLNTAGAKTVTASEVLTAAITGVTASITVVAASAMHHFHVTWSGGNAGQEMLFVVTAKDASNVTKASYAGEVYFAATDTQAVLPPNGPLTNGVGTFVGTLKTIGNQTVTVRDTVTASFVGTVVAAPNLGGGAKFLIITPEDVNASEAFSFTVSATDAYNNVNINYIGAPIFTSTDPLASLPVSPFFNGGVAVFEAALATAGPQTITATDTGSGLVGTSDEIEVA